MAQFNPWLLTDSYIQLAPKLYGQNEYISYSVIAHEVAGGEKPFHFEIQEGDGSYFHYALDIHDIDASGISLYRYDNGTGVVWSLHPTATNSILLSSTKESPAAKGERGTYVLDSVMGGAKRDIRLQENFVNALLLAKAVSANGA